MARDPKPQNNVAVTTPPPPDEYKFVVRRDDRRAAWPWRVNVSYSRTAVSYDITCGGARAPTLFLETAEEKLLAFRHGWRDDITEAFAAQLAGTTEAEPPAELTVETVADLKYQDLKAELKTRGLDTSGKTGALRERLTEALTAPRLDA